ncbi:MAG: hypothetical protein Q4G52_06780 [Clostridia bacterium]|nr:hypothetical protein [Clostridia bacterium]
MTLSHLIIDFAHLRHVPVFLVIGELDAALGDPSLSMQLAERTVPVQLMPGMRPDVELLCQRAGALFSGEGALPLCALLLADGRPFLAAPLPPPGFPLDPSRLFVWLTQADRRFSQNLPALMGQASEVIRSFRVPALRRPLSAQDAAHQLMRALNAIEDKANGGFGQIKAPLVTGLRFIQHAAASGDRQAHAALSRALDAMLSSSLYDPLDGSFFRATLTDDWRAFSPEKPLGINAMLALILLESGRRSEAMRTLDSLISTFSLPGGALTPYLRVARDACAFTPEQVCAALGSEPGLRACRLLRLLHQHAREQPRLTPSRFSPVDDAPSRPSIDEEPLCPELSPSLTPEDSAFLRRVLPALLRLRAARTPPQSAPFLLTQDCALAAAVLAQCGQRLGEARYTQAAQRAVSSLSALPGAQGGLLGLPPAFAPASPLLTQATCGAGAALALALLTLGKGEGMGEYAKSGLRLLSATLHAFVTPEGMVMHTPRDPAAFFPRVPALEDSELPSPAALLVHALRMARDMQPEAHYGEAIEAVWQAASPSAAAHPLALAGLIDAVNPL